MLVLKVLGIMMAVGFVGIVAITIASDVIDLSKTPSWLEKAYNFIWKR